MLQRWKSDTRVYLACLEVDLLGDLLLVTRWGGRFSRLGGSKSMPVASVAEGLRALQGVARRRTSRGYAEVHG